MPITKSIVLLGIALVILPLSGCAAPMNELAVKGSTEEMAERLDSDPAAISERGKYGATALLCAVAAHRVDMVRLLVDRGARIQTGDDFGCTPIGIAESLLGSFSPKWIKGQEDYMRQRKLPEERIGAQMAKINAAHSDQAKKDWQAIVEILKDGLKAEQARDRESPLFSADKWH